MRRGVGLVVAAVLLVGCSGGEPAPRAAASPTVDPAAAAALSAATDFLGKLVAEEHADAYVLLSEQARAALTVEDFARAREEKAGSARSLGRRYSLSGTSGAQPVLTVTGEGFLADGTEVRLSLPVRQVGDRWLVDAAPTAF